MANKRLTQAEMMCQIFAIPSCKAATPVPKVSQPVESGALVAGIDGCPGGWLAVLLQLSGEVRQAAVARAWTGLPLDGVRMAAVDMPVGLRDRGPRACDRAARALLPRARKPSVFPPPRRYMLGAADWAAANAAGKAHEGIGLSRQAWNLAAKIGELDRALAPDNQARLREAHPELVFHHLNGWAALPRKTTAAGRTARRDLLLGAGLTGLDGLLEAVPRRLARPDDLLDAAACALAARRMLEGTAVRLPGGPPPRDARGLAMEIWY